jgi:pimeloyl-ACP methyl ester carboxylesterase/DNA-binding CsgD family transcriptional regulator
MPVPAIRFCQTPGGQRVAYATAGSGPPLVMVPGWLCHLEEIWGHPSAATAREKFSAEHTFVWYDRLGCGLSDRDGFEPSVENDVEQLIAVMDAAEIERADMIGYSFGAPTAAAFAARYPERVRRLVFYSAFARGAAVTTREGMDSLTHLVRTNWGLGSRTLATMLVPNGSAQDLRWFAKFQRMAATAELAARLLEYLWVMDVTSVLPEVRTPSLVLHNRHDRAVPLSAGREIAALVPGAQLHVLEGNEHDPFIRDSGAVVESILAFVEDRALPSGEAPNYEEIPLTEREREVLRMIAEGASNKRIAAELGITVATVERHVSNIYGKINAGGRADATMRAVAMGLVMPEGR